MTMPQSTTPTKPSLGRDIPRTARYYLGNRWALLVLGSVAVIIGLFFGGWGWLVAAGVAPVILSVLPCLVMCAFGLCMMGRSDKSQSAASRDATDAATSSTFLGLTRRDRLPGSSCCHNEATEMRSPQVQQVQSREERRDSHA
jgi:hypothetical protein